MNVCSIETSSLADKLKLLSYFKCGDCVPHTMLGSSLLNFLTTPPLNVHCSHRTLRLSLLTVIRSGSIDMEVPFSLRGLWEEPQ